jgi:hypothetical protein
MFLLSAERIWMFKNGYRYGTFSRTVLGHWYVLNMFSSTFYLFNLLAILQRLMLCTGTIFVAYIPYT